jgi:hypothetical protein
VALPCAECTAFGVESENCDVNCDIAPRKLPVVTLIDRLRWRATEWPEAMTTQALDRTSSLTVAGRLKSHVHTDVRRDLGGQPSRRGTDVMFRCSRTTAAT